MKNLFYCIFILSIVNNISCTNELPMLVNTNTGPVQGHLINDNTVIEWKGIPYAKPPLNELRFMPPQAHDKWNNIYQADFDGPGCPQTCDPESNEYCPLWTSEDCLYLNIWSPSKPSEDPNGYPVFVYIHGGDWIWGTGLSYGFNSSKISMAGEGVVTVTINYRLGALGFLASESMNGNYGLLDQQYALKYIQENVKAFGGNPEKITLTGESIGGMAVLCHLTAPSSKGLFHKAIMQSNPISLPYHTKEDAANVAADVADAINCDRDDVECFRQASIDDLLYAQTEAAKDIHLKSLWEDFLAFGPIVYDDSDLGENSVSLLYDQPYNLFISGNWNKVPLLTGSLIDDAYIFVYGMFKIPIPERLYERSLKLLFGRNNVDDIMELYPADMLGNTHDTRDVLSVVGTDFLFTCPVRNITRQAMLYEKENTDITFWLYRFDHAMSFDPWPEEYSFCNGYVCHGGELPFVFDIFSDPELDLYYDPTIQEKILTKNLMTYWNNFIETANPNGDDLLNWTQYDPETDTYLILEEPLSEITNLRSEYCDLWDEIGYIL